MSENLKKGEELLALIRSSDIHLLDADDNENMENVFDGIIEKATYLGDKVDYRIIAGNNLEIRVQTGRTSKFRKGDKIKIHIPVDSCKAILND